MAKPVVLKEHKLDINSNCTANLEEINEEAQKAIDKAKGSSYSKDFCNKLVKHMAEGYDFNSFAKVVGVSQNTLNRWVIDRPLFKEAKEVGEAAYYHHWIDLGIKGAKGLVKGYNASTWIFTMKNKFGWKDIVENAIKSESTVYEVQVTREGRFASARPKAV